MLQFYLIARERFSEGSRWDKTNIVISFNVLWIIQIIIVSRDPCHDIIITSQVHIIQNLTAGNLFAFSSGDWRVLSQHTWTGKWKDREYKFDLDNALSEKMQNKPKLNHYKH